MHHSSSVLRAALLALATLLASGCAAFPPGTPLPDILPEINATLQPNEVLLQPGDGIEVTFTDAPQGVSLDQTTKVRPDGRANFRLLGELDVAGLSIGQLQDELTTMYDKVVVAPPPLVRSTSLSERKVFFIGAVGGQTALTVGPGMTIDLIEAFSRENVPKDTFSLIEHTVLIRWMPNEKKRRYWVIDASPKYWANEELLQLQGGDIIYIPTHPIRITTQWVRELVKLLPVPHLLSVST